MTIKEPKDLLGQEVLVHIHGFGCSITTQGKLTASADMFVVYGPNMERLAYFKKAHIQAMFKDLNNLPYINIDPFVRA
jgi:hypothetical protein